MKMPNGLIAECRTSYSESSNFLKVEAEKGWFELQPAFNYSGLKGNTSNGQMDFLSFRNRPNRWMHLHCQSKTNNKVLCRVKWAEEMRKSLKPFMKR